MAACMKTMTSHFVQLCHTNQDLCFLSLIPRPPPFLFFGSIIHGSGRARKTGRFRVLYRTQNRRTINGGGLGMSLRPCMVIACSVCVCVCVCGRGVLVPAITQLYIHNVDLIIALQIAYGHHHCAAKLTRS